MDKKEWEEYLSGNSPLSHEYHKHAQEKTPDHLDNIILSAAQLKQKRKKNTGPFGFNWMIPISLAAVLVISISIVPLMQEQFRTHEAAMQPSTTPQVDKKESSAPVARSQPKISKSAPRPSAKPAPRRQMAVQDRMREARKAAESARAKKDTSRFQIEKEKSRAKAMTKRSLQGMTSPSIENVPEKVTSTATEKSVEVQAMIEKIRKLMIEGKTEEARTTLEEFRKQYPDYPIQNALEKEYPDLF
jgi:hypothetical protein